MAFTRNPIKVDGNVIRVLRVVRGLSQRELGQRAGIAPHKVFRIEHVLDTPTEEELSKLMGALTTDEQR